MCIVVVVSMFVFCMFFNMWWYGVSDIDVLLIVIYY